MRDLEQYLPSFKKEKYLRGRSGHNTESESVTIEAIERAIKAEMLKDILNKELYEKDGDLEELRTENAQLRKVVEAAREFISSTGCNPKECGKCDPKYINFCERSRIGQALAELDEADHD